MVKKKTNQRSFKKYKMGKEYEITANSNIKFLRFNFGLIDVKKANHPSQLPFNSNLVKKFTRQCCAVTQRQLAGDFGGSSSEA